MFGNESRLYLGGAAIVGVAGAAYFVLSGDRMGSVLFLALVLGASFLGLLLVAKPVADLEAAAAPAPGDVRLGATAARATAWPLVAAFAAALLIVGVAVDVPIAVMALCAVALVTAGWFVQAWREQADRISPTALEVHERVLWPAGLPVLTLVFIAGVIVCVSRVLLALPEEIATTAAIFMAAGVLLVATLVALRPMRSTFVMGAVAGVALALAAAGVAAAVAGQREEEHFGVRPVNLRAKGTAFDKKVIELPASSAVTVRFDNEDEGILHNVAIYESRRARRQLFFGDSVEGLGRARYVFRTPEPGTYFFRCEFHPGNMVGTVKVTEPSEEEKR